MPLKAAGILIDPPKSEPTAKGTHLEATNAASPPELPPHDLSLFLGFLEVPHTGFSLWTVSTH